jgi:seryl-tRNA synthetase
MFDIRAIRETPDDFRKAWSRRKAGLGEETVSRMLELDTAWRAATTARQDAEGARNANSKLIGQAKARKDEAEAERLMSLVADAKTAIEAAEAEEKTKRAALDDLLMGMPNLPLEEVPEGADEHGNVEQSRWGTPKGISHPKDHADLGEALKVPGGLSMMDFEAAARMSGARFVALRGQLARMERALANFMLDIQTTEHGYQETSTPILVREQALLGTGQLPKFEEDMFRTTSGHYLISTSEISLTNLVREQVVDVSQLPIRMTAHTPCFRSEAGSAGRDTRGMIRQHQFYKVELVSIVAGEAEGLAELDRMTACAEEVLKRLELPFRRMLLCAGDMGAGARKTYDLEVWLPSQDTYREISSCSYCGDFQARRMNARYRVDAKSKPEFVHTLNGSGLAVGRTLVAVLENYQNADGSVTVPEALVAYMGGVTEIR